MTLTEINELTYLDCIELLITRMLDTSAISGAIATIVDTESLSDYERVLVHESLIKPTEEQILAELAEYKAELTAEENTRLQKEEELLHLSQRIEVAGQHILMHDFTAIYLGEHRPNTKAYWNRELKPVLEAGINQEDPFLSETETLEAIELLYVTYDAGVVAKEQDELLSAQAALIIQRCDNAVVYIVKYNTRKYVEGLLDSAGLDALEVTFADVMAALNNKRPEKAAVTIEALDLTGTIYTETERTEIVNILRA